MHFFSAAREVNVDTRVFRNIDELVAKLESPLVKHAYHQCFLLPFIKKYSAAQCRQALMRRRR